MSDPQHTPDYEPPSGKPMRQDFRGLIALVLAVAVALMLVIGVSGVAWSGREISEAGREVLVALGGVIVGGLISYIGMKVLNGS